MRREILALAVFGAAACSAAAAEASELAAPRASIHTDSSRLAVDGGSIWYRVTGTGTGTPVILLHGGPGFSSYYLKSMEALGDDRLVVRYDQLGGGKSDRMVDTTKFTIAHFVAELEALRRHLGLQRVHVYGHSWGTILGLEYYRAHPEHVASLVLASAALDLPAWERNARRLLATLPDSMQRAVQVREAERNYEAADYQAALAEFYGRYVWRHPVPADLDSSMASFNPAIYGYMQGPSEFTITGTLKDYDAKPFLEEIRVPVLYTVGEFDEANPEIIGEHAALTPGARLVVIPGAAHLVQWDNPEANLRAVREFLREVDQR
ncbi:MAG: proline iminopeptidase-family hydrolase [Candidatus Latescibacterota bacterium]